MRHITIIAGARPNFIKIAPLIDSILGALSKKDIGSYFPSTIKKFKNIDSTLLLKEVIKKNNFNKLLINNIDKASNLAASTLLQFPWKQAKHHVECDYAKYMGSVIYEFVLGHNTVFE